MIASAPQARLFPLQVINYTLAANHKFKPQQGHKSRNGIVFTPKTLRVCVDALYAEIVCVGRIMLLSLIHCFVPFCFNLGWFWSKQGKWSYGKTLVCFSGQGETMRQHVKNQPSDTRWGLDVQWEREGGGVLGSVQHRQPASESESWWLISSPSSSPSRLLNAMVCALSHPHQHLSSGLRGGIILRCSRYRVNYHLGHFSSTSCVKSRRTMVFKGARISLHWNELCSEP